jgi:hypothetical protein
LVTENEEFPPRFGIVSFLDILGTRSVSNDDEATEFLNKITQLYDDFEGVKEGMREYMPLVKNINFKVGNEEVSPFKEEETIPQLGLEVSTFSDTLILALYSNEPIMDSFFVYLFGFFFIPLFRRALVNQICLRGTVSIGKFYSLTKNNRILLIGPAVYNAAQSFEKTDWIGISASPSASLTMEQEHGIDLFLNKLSEIDLSVSLGRLKVDNMKKLIHAVKDSFINYDIPTKDGFERNGWALSWPAFFDSSDTYHSQEDVKQILDEKLLYQKYQRTSIGLGDL